MCLCSDFVLTVHVRPLQIGHLSKIKCDDRVVIERWVGGTFRAEDTSSQGSKTGIRWNSEYKERPVCVQHNVQKGKKGVSVLI